MKLYNNPFARVNIPGCVCGKSDGTMDVYKQVVQRQVIFLTLGILGVIGLTLVLGFEEAFRIFWWLMALVVGLLIVLGAMSAPSVKKGHSIRCAIRTATYKLF